MSIDASTVVTSIQTLIAAIASYFAYRAAKAAQGATDTARETARRAELRERERRLEVVAERVMEVGKQARNAQSAQPPRMLIHAAKELQAALASVSERLPECRILIEMTDAVRVEGQYMKAFDEVEAALMALRRKMTGI